jgi:copper chaperone CopZ
MKKFFLILLLGTVAAFAGDKHEHKHAKGENMMCELDKGQAHTDISVPTAQCGSCAKTINAALDKVEGVDDVYVNIKEKKVHVHYADAKVKVAELEKAIAEAGYDANDVKRDEKAHENLPACCQMKR